MAIGWNPYDDPYSAQRMRQEFEAQKSAAYEQMRGMQNSHLGQGLGGQQLSQAQAPKPVPQPEPNKVLLLLGEDA